MSADIFSFVTKEMSQSVALLMTLVNNLPKRHLSACIRSGRNQGMWWMGVRKIWAHFMLWWSVHILPICCAKCAPRNGVFTPWGTFGILNQRAEFLLWKEPILKSITFNRCLTIKSLWCCLLLVGWPNIQLLLWRLGSCYEITFLHPKVLPPMITWCAPPLALQQMLSAQLFFGCLFAYPSPSALRMKWH